MAHRVAVVTGGGSGLGQSISAQLARAGRQVAVLDVNGEAADEVAAELRAGSRRSSERRQAKSESLGRAWSSAEVRDHVVEAHRASRGGRGW